MPPGLHHLHRRKRIHDKRESYPSKNKWIRLLDRFLLIVAIFGPFVALPQIIKIITLQSAYGLSLPTWVLYSLGNIPWVIYGTIHKDKPIIIAYSLWFIMNLTIVTLILIYQ